MPGISEELFVASDNLPIRLYCSICLDVAEAAVITQCDHLFCQFCLTQLQEANGLNCECPNCRKHIQPISPATNARNFLAQQQVYCSDIEELRCGWIGKYSMWHTHRAKYCPRATQADKKQAKNANFSEIGQFTKDELMTMSVGRLKKILQEYIKLHINKLTEHEIKNDYNYKKYLEKSEYVVAILQIESIHGVSAKYNNSISPSRNNNNHHHFEEKQEVEYPTTYDGLKKLKIRQLSAYLRSKNIDPTSPEYNCIEKADLIHLVLKTQKHYRDILKGHRYDPTMERGNFSPPPATFTPEPIHPVNLDLDHDHDHEHEQKEEQPLIDIPSQVNPSAVPPAPSSSAYQFNSEHLRQSSINRVDLNPYRQQQQHVPSQQPQHGQQQQPVNTAYSHVYNNHQHSTRVNRGNLPQSQSNNNGNGNGYGAMQNDANINRQQRMYQTQIPSSQHNMNYNHNHYPYPHHNPSALHNHNNPHPPSYHHPFHPPQPHHPQYQQRPQPQHPQHPNPHQQRRQNLQQQQQRPQPQPQRVYHPPQQHPHQQRPQNQQQHQQHQQRQRQQPPPHGMPSMSGFFNGWNHGNMPQMPDVSQIVNTAMSSVNEAMTSVFSQPFFTNHHAQRQPQPQAQPPFNNSRFYYSQ